MENVGIIRARERERGMHLSLVKDTMFVLSTRGVPSRDLFVSYSYSSPFLSLQHIALSVHT